jgi:hypothetical protein
LVRERDSQGWVVSSSSEGSSGLAFALFAAGPATGLFISGWIRAKYRNKGARYMPERVVKHTITKMTEDDKFLKKIVSRSSSISGRNDQSPAQRAQFTRTTKE